MRSPAKPRHNRARSVFIGCPFDTDCKPRGVLGFSDSGAIRFTEVVKTIMACHPSIHDSSRVELGADLGLRLAGPPLRRRRKTLKLVPGGPPLLGGAAINEDHDTYLEMAPDIAASADANANAKS